MIAFILAMGSGEYAVRVPLLEVWSHSASGTLLTAVRQLEAASTTARERVLLTQPKAANPPDADGVILADGSGGGWALEKAAELVGAAYHGLIVVVTSPVSDDVVVQGHAAGVHIWKTMPLQSKLLAAQIASLVRRLIGQEHELEVSVRVNRAARVVVVDGKRCRLAPRGFALFVYLLERREHWVSRAEILKQVYGTPHDEDSAIVRVNVHTIRGALGPSHDWILQGREGDGYRVTLRRDSTPARLGLPHPRRRR